MQDELRHITLIHKELSNELDASERVALRDWQSSQPEASTVYEETKKTWSLCGKADAASDWTPDTECALTKFWARLSEQQAETRPEAHQNLGRQRRMPVWSWAAAAAVLCLLGLGFWQFWGGNIGAGAKDWQTVVAETGQNREVRLPDGSSVQLRGGTTLSFPKKFSAQERPVRLQGEAFFDIAKDAARPFRIETRSAQISVLGTSFNVRESNDGQQCAVAVRTGLVQVSPKNGEESVLLKAGDRLDYNAQAHRMTQTTGRPINDDAWLRGELQFQDTPLNTVVADLAAHYQVTVALENSVLGNCLYTGRFQANSIGDNLSAVAKVFGARIEEPAAGAYRLVGGKCQ